jgi:hypothetical protein
MRVPLVPGDTAFTYPDRISVPPNERMACACIAARPTPERPCAPRASLFKVLRLIIRVRLNEGVAASRLR